MIALSIRQPWAWLIVRPDIIDAAARVEAYRTYMIKDVENREWLTRYRGEFLIHAGKQLDDDCKTQEGYDNFAATVLWDRGITLPPRDHLQLGGIVGKARITDCDIWHDSPWFFGKFGFTIADAMPLPFLPCPGKLGFFEVDYRLPVERVQ